MGNFGKKLRVARKKRGLTLDQVYERSGVQPGEISRVERGLRDPKVSTLEKLAAAVGIPVGQLFD